jgi:hypothetical protein
MVLGAIELKERKKTKIKSILIVFFYADLLTMLIVGSTTPLQHQLAALLLLLRPREGGVDRTGIYVDNNDKDDNVLPSCHHRSPPCQPFPPVFSHAP